MLKRGFFLLSAFLSLGMITCSNPPTNPGEDLRNVTVTVLPPDEDKESIAGEPVTVGVYLTMAKHIEEVTVSFDNYDFDTTFSYDQSDKWFDTLYITRVIPDSGTARGRATVKVRNDERSRSDEFELEILPKPFELAFDSSMTTHFLKETADTILFSIVSNRGEPDSVAAKLISGQEDTSDIELDYKDLAGKIPLLLNSPGIYTLFLTLEDSTFRDDTSFTISAHNQPCFADTPDLTKNLVLGSSDTLNFSACADSFDNSAIEMLNSDDFPEGELDVSSTEGSLTGDPFTMTVAYTPAQAQVCTFYVAVTNGFFHDTLKIIRDVKEEIPVLAEITKQPESKEVKAGGSATIRVEATGKGLTYQWQQDQKDIPDANQTSLLLVGVTSEFDGRKYRCVVSNDAGDVSSEEAEISVLYSVTYDGNDHDEGSVPEDSAFYKAGESVTLAGNTGDLDRTGFTFSGWSRVAGDTTEIYSPGDTLLMDSGNLTVYAVWKKSIYDVIFNPRNGEVSTATTAVHGSLINEPGEPVRSGFRFSGWFTEKSGETMWDFPSDTVENSMTLYANWVAVYTVTYDANGAQGRPPRDTSLYEEGAYITVSPPDSLTNSDSLFLCWSDKADSTGNEYYPGDKILVEDKDLVLYARWTIHPTFTISYEGNQNTDGEAPEDNSRYKEGDEVTVAGAGTLERTGHTFAGWYTDSVYTEDFYAADDVFAMPAQDMTLYAYWTENPTYKVTYDLNGGEGTVPVDNNLYESGTQVTLKPKGDLNRDEYEFVGWETDSGKRYATGSKYTMGDSSITFYARWTQNPTFSVTYFANGSNVTGSVPVDTDNYEESDTVLVAQPGTMKLTGHSFSGWNLSQAGDSTSYAKGAKMAMPSADVELYAQWRKNTYTAYFLDSEGGTAIDSQKVSYNETASEIEPSPRDGYTFEGWFTESDVQFNFATPVTGNLILHPQWSENPTYTVLYLPNNTNVTGSAPEDTNSYEQGDSLVVKGQGSMELAGHTFDCWATTPGGNVK
ncbi:MAG: InlB B-repeat-containing protein, partial [Chitinispirillaceae bacterium]